MDASHSLISELENAIESGSKDKRVDTLRRITDLFVSDADRLNDLQIDVFDDVLGHLSEQAAAAEGERPQADERLGDADRLLHRGNQRRQLIRCEGMITDITCDDFCYRAQVDAWWCVVAVHDTFLPVGSFFTSFT